MTNLQKKSPFSTRFETLQSFRGFAILWIVLHHYLTAHEVYGPLVFGFFQIGYVGVTVFFVVGGFAIGMSAHRMREQGEGAFQFLKKRAARIYVPYLFSLVFAALLIPAALTFLSSLKSSLSTDALKEYAVYYLPHYSAAEWLGFITLTKIFTADSWQLNRLFLPLNGVLWFIAVLMQMYLVIAAALGSRRFYGHVLTAVTLFSFIALIPAVKQGIPYGFFLPFWPQFAAGLALCEAVRRGWIPRSGPLFQAGLTSLYLIFAGVLLYLCYTHTLFGLVLGGLFWMLLPFDKLLSGFRLMRFFAWLGSFSYSIYLIHVPLEPLLLALIRNALPQVPFYAADLILEIPLAILISRVWYLFFEKPGTAEASVRALCEPLRTLTGKLKTSRLWVVGR